MPALSKEHWIMELNLSPHPEGGWFRELYRNNVEIPEEITGTAYKGNRNLATSIYFMLAQGNISKLHRLKSDELWYFHFGSPITVHVFHDGAYHKFTMGTDIDQQQKLQLIIPAGAIFGAEVEENEGYTIVGCMVSPGFHFDDFELLNFTEVSELYPSYIDLIQKFT